MVRRSGVERLARVLVVDDSPDNRRFVAACLRSDDVVIDEAGDGLTALGLVLERRPDVVVLDVDLPVLDGLGALRGIRAAGLGPDDVRVIAFTARSEPDASARCTEAGADDYLAKPVRDPSVLRGKVRAHLADLSYRRTAAPMATSLLGARSNNRYFF